MDINYLLWLQDLRAATHNVLTPLMRVISSVAASYLVFVPVFIYWCWDKKRGLLTLASFYLAATLTAVIKLTACVYRPWIKDPRIIPAVKSLPHSYSFPSNHAVSASVLYLGSAVAFWQKKQTKFLAVLCIVLVLLTLFSRNYLGVHMPQDVFAGFLLGIVCLYSVWELGLYLKKNPHKENLLLITVAAAGIAALLFIIYKSYPMDYSGDKLIVNPQKMKAGAFESCGALISFCAARYIEKTWICFKATGLNFKGIMYGLCGLFVLYLLTVYGYKPLKVLVGRNWGHFAFSFISVFYIIALYPLILKWLCKQK